MGSSGTPRPAVTAKPQQVLVALNSIFQSSLFAARLAGLPLGPTRLALGLPQSTIITSPWQIANPPRLPRQSPARRLLSYGSARTPGRDWYDSTFCPESDVGAVRLLFTIVILLRCRTSDHSPSSRFLRIAVPLLGLPFAFMWGGGYLLGAILALGYPRTTTLALSPAAGNNFELASRVCIATLTVPPRYSLAGVVVPLIEVPVLVALVYGITAPKKDDSHW